MDRESLEICLIIAEVENLTEEQLIELIRSKQGEIDLRELKERKAA